MHISRRHFIKASLGSASLAAFCTSVPAFLARAAAAEPSQSSARGNILVVLQLSGGNDGLNTVVPFADDLYHRHRPTLRLTAERVLKITDQLGLHPEMAAFHRLFHEGNLSVAQGVGCPGGSRDHGAALRAWQTAKPGDDFGQTGWLGRAIDQALDGDAALMPGVFLGEIPRPFSLHAEKAVVPSIADLSEWTSSPWPGAAGRSHFSRLGQIAREVDPAADPLLRQMRQVTLDACALAQRVEAAAPTESDAGYPLQFTLARTLRTIAQLIRADSGLRLYCAELGGGGIGGFDTHANQAANHGALLRQMAESVAAFVRDLQRDRLLERVLILTFSEFGRTVAENGRHGTDHGLAAPMFLAGGRRKAGLLGRHPSLKDLDGGGLKCQMDFRHVYCAVLEQWLGCDSSAILGSKLPAAPVMG